MAAVVCLPSTIWVALTNLTSHRAPSCYTLSQENHRTDTAYEDNLIAKTFMFQFVNSYASLVYIAFIKEHIGQT